MRHTSSMGLQLLRNDGPKQDFLPQSKEALAGWRKEKPGTTRLPVPEEFVFDVASRMLDSGRVDIAVAMTLQLHCSLRPSEVLALTKAHVSAPSVGRYHKWGLVIPPLNWAWQLRLGPLMILFFWQMFLISGG